MRVVVTAVDFDGTELTQVGANQFDAPMTVGNIGKGAAPHDSASSAIHYDLDFERDAACFRENCAVRGYITANRVRLNR